MLETPSISIPPMKSPFSFLSKTGNHEEVIEQTPREKWLKKEKVLKTKFFVILFLTHSLWLLNSQSTSPVLGPKEIPPLLGHHILKLPALVLSDRPHPGEKKAVSLYLKQKLIAKKAYLHHTSSSNDKTKLEMPERAARKIKDLKEDEVIKVLPYLFTKTEKKRRGVKIYEMDI